VLDQDLSTLSSASRDRMRADHLGVIFQMFNLVPYLSVIGNVTLPLKFSAARRKAVAGAPDDEARRLLGRLGLTDRRLLERRVSDLSVGQQQRVAAARAVIGGPEIVIADEPTSALDSEVRDRFIALLSEETARTGAALLFVSHDASLAGLFDRAVDLADINRAEVRA
jgi:putative ABC transport system ATP-binding protein